MAEDGADTPRSLKIVLVGVTSTLYWLMPDVMMKLPAVPDRPHVAVPWTEVTGSRSPRWR
jgi:hypothetical protein